MSCRCGTPGSGLLRWTGMTREVEVNWAEHADMSSWCGVLMTVCSFRDEAVRKHQYLLVWWWVSSDNKAVLDVSSVTQVEFKFLLWLYIAFYLLCSRTSGILKFFQVSYWFCAFWLKQRLLPWTVGLDYSTVLLYEWGNASKEGLFPWEEVFGMAAVVILLDVLPELKAHGRTERKEGGKEERKEENLQNTSQHQQKTSAFGEDHKYGNHTLPKL